MSNPEVHDVVTATDQPVVLIVGLYGERWHYQWWDTGYDYVSGEPPTRVKTALSLQQCLPMLLSDHSRSQLTAELRQTPQT